MIHRCSMTYTLRKLGKKRKTSQGTFATASKFHSFLLSKAMEHLVEKGLVNSIGVSNFNISQMEEVLKIAKKPVVVNQVENHPCIDQRELIDFCKSKNILVTAYSPLGSPDRSWTTEKDPNIQEDPVVKKIAEHKGCTPVQLLIAYNLCQGLLCIPKSVTPSRIRQNFQALGVQLTKEEIEKLDTLVTDYRACAWEFWSHHPYYPFPEEVEKLSDEMIK
ncbi:Aldose reductase [Holothuria leucospilota]|uniref:Aldose reductase n=1 Tax=Holothuria leucospilota TaxID=206669 RepID=A0A9Q1H487_HOLLE|nr:Aldose reductase [Holothuria leucospilota]